MTTVNDKFQSQNGFESPNFTVDATGKITAPVLDVSQILLNGETFVQYTPPEDTGGGDDGPAITNSFESLAVTGGTLRVSYLGDQALTVTNGVIAINSLGTGSIDNVNIGYNTPGQVRTYSLDMVPAPDSTASEINLNDATFNGDLNVVDNVILTNNPTNSSHATRKSYVDATATALAVAFGA